MPSFIQKDLSINTFRAVRRYAVLLLLLLFSSALTLAQTTISSLSDITDPNGTYILSSGFSTTGTALVDGTGDEIGTSTNPFRGTIDGGLETITGTWNKPLFNYVQDAIIKNVIIGNASISVDGAVGALAGTASGATRIYNCGILSGTVGSTFSNTDSPKTTNCCGSLVGLLNGTARVINCFSYATITNGNRVGGIVGYNNGTTKASSITTMIMNCMFYGDITGGNKVSPIYGGNNINNLNSGGLNTFNFYAYDKLKTKAITDGMYNCALAVEERFLTRFEFYRLLLNSNKKLAAIYITGNASDANLLAKWVLETADKSISSPKPYPILKAQGTYPSIINYDTRNLSNYSADHRNEGLKTGTLAVTISESNTTGGGQTKASGATVTTTSMTLVRTDKDFERFNYNYDKVQLPYYNDIGTNNYTDGKVVTGWKITAVTAGNGDNVATQGSYTASDSWGGYNFADRMTYAKDLYDVSGRVFSQGAYFDVPYGVTGITIEPYWGYAAYIADVNYDAVFSAKYDRQNVSQLGTQVDASTTFGGKDVKTSINDALGTIDTPGATVYDNAIVLVGNFHQSVINKKDPFQSGTTPFTLMSVDLDNDHEPDYSLIYHDNSRSRINPIRFDFLNIPGTAQAHKPNGTSTILNASIFNASAWFEITNTCLIYFSQFEYENSGKTANKSPIILLGGVFDQFTSTKVNQVQNTTYIHVGSNAWFKEFNNGTHSDGNKSTKHIPISVTGGDYDAFYLTGTYNSNAAVRNDDAECYISGGHFKEMAGAGLEQIGGSVRWLIYDADIDNFFGGGINDAKPIKGAITTEIFNSHVGVFCGGPKFGNMVSGKKVATTAKGCTFGKFFGAGYGGNSISRKKYFDSNKDINWGTTLQGYYTTDKEKYFDGENVGLGPDADHLGQYGYKGRGVATDFDYEFFVWTSGTTGGRFFVKFATFSLAQCENVESRLSNCTINGNFYGGGNLGEVTGTATSILDDCTVNGNVFGGGFSAELPKIPVRSSGFTTVPNYNSKSGMFEPGVFSATTDYEWKNASEAGVTLTDGGAGSDGSHYIYTDKDLTALGQVHKTHLTLTGNTYVSGTVQDGGETAGGVFGGGDASEVNDSCVVLINTTDQKTLLNVFGGGNEAGVGGNTRVELKGGSKIQNNVYGGGNKAGVDGNTNVIITSGAVLGGVYGGCNEQGGIGGDISISLNSGTVGADVFGGGLGSATTTNGNIDLTLDGTAVTGDIYGGSALGSVNDAVTDRNTVNILSGSVNNIYGGGMGESGQENVSKGQVNGEVTVNIGAVDNGGETPVYSGSATINGSVYGCNNTNGSPQADVTVHIYQTAHNEPQGGYAIDQVFGGGNLADYSPASTDNRATVHVYTCSNTIRRVFGGGNAADALGVVTVIDGGTFDQVFGGGNGETSTANIGDGGTNLTVHGGVINQLFGGSNTSGTIFGPMITLVDGTGECAASMNIAEFFCGNNLANIGTEQNPTSIIATIGCGTTFGDVYGGCSLADIWGDVTLTIEGGTINNVYGGSKGDLASLNEAGQTSHFDKPADINGNVILNIFGGDIRYNAFGGSNINGNITGSITVNMDWSRASSDCNSESDLHVGNVYGASNLASYTPYDADGLYPSVNISHGTVSQSVFGGGKGQSAVVTSNPVVTIGDDNDEHYVTVTENIYGGGDAAAVIGNAVVSIQNTHSTAAKLFGGGNAAGVSGNTHVILPEGTITSGIYGGCNTTGTIGGNTQVDVTGGTIGTTDAHANIHGGGYGHGTAVSGNVTVNIGNVTINENTPVYSGNAIIYGDVYGGSALGTVNTAYDEVEHSTYDVTTVNLYSGTIDGNVYGGGLGDTITLGTGHSNIAAKVYGDVNVFQYGVVLISRTKADPEISGLMLPESGIIFGCNNVNGTPKGHVKVVVYNTTGTGTQDKSYSNKSTTVESDHVYDMLAVYGGGNRAAYEPDSDSESTEVIINGCDEVSIHSVYGGGNAATTPATKVTVNGAYEIEYVFGGGNGAGTGNPGANVGYKAYPESISGPEQVAERADYIYGTGISQTSIYGGRIHQVFGGSNTKGNVRNASVAMLDELGDCDLALDGFYGGGKSAYMEGMGDIYLGCVSGLDEIYGGAEKADVGSDVVLTLTSGHYNKVYGGNNLSGNIHGSITVNIEQTGCLPITIGELFGGGNHASYSVYGYNSNGSFKTSEDGEQLFNDPVINIRSCQSINTIYGGGEGKSATLVGSPHINVNIVKGWVDGQHENYSTPQELTDDGVIGTIYGGGKQADVIGDTHISIADQATVDMESLKELKSIINSTISIESNGSIEFGITGSGDEEAITYTKSGESTPTLTKTIKQTVNGATITGNIYGGGNEADITGATHIKIGPEE